jgi:hypothetical protein
MSSAEGTEEAEKIHNEGTTRAEPNEGCSESAISVPVWPLSPSSRAALCAVWSEKDRPNKHRARSSGVCLTDLFCSTNAGRRPARDCWSLRSSSFPPFLRCEPRSLRGLSRARVPSAQRQQQVRAGRRLRGAGARHSSCRPAASGIAARRRAGAAYRPLPSAIDAWCVETKARPG